MGGSSWRGWPGKEGRGGFDRPRLGLALGEGTGRKAIRRAEALSHIWRNGFDRLGLGMGGTTSLPGGEGQHV